MLLNIFYYRFIVKYVFVKNMVFLTWWCFVLTGILYTKLP